jgi:hypothetical protein
MKDLATEEASSPSNKHEALQNSFALLTFFFFVGYFLPTWIRFWIRIPNPDPDPETQVNVDPIRI